MQDCKFRKTNPQQKMFAMKIALLHARKTPKTPISKTLICNQRRKRKFSSVDLLQTAKSFFQNVDL